MDIPLINRNWVLRQRPDAELKAEDFELREGPVGEPAAGQVLVRVRMISIDPANRAWMFPTATYKAPVEPGQTMHGFGIGEVLASRADNFAVGDMVEGMVGWQEYAMVSGSDLTVRRAGTPPEHAMGVLGITGLTALYGLREIGRPRPGETVVVSAAAGAVGTIAAQIAKLDGCRVVGIAGGPEKCQWLVSELGLDAAVDYKAGDLRKALKRACPEGVDVYFDNTGGDALAAALSAMNVNGRIVCCGNLSQYNTDRPAPGPAAVPGLLVTKRIRMEGFIVLDHLAHRDEMESTLQAWLHDGSLKSFETVVDGLSQAPESLVRMFRGGNRGKMLVRLNEQAT